MTGWRLVCDIGGSNLRMARSDRAGEVHDVVVRAVVSCAPLPVEINAYRRGFSDAAELEAVVIAAAGPVDHGAVALTNIDLTLDAADLSARLGRVPVRIFNDLEAVAIGLPALDGADLRPVVDPPDPLDGPRLVINIGTGFGGALAVETPSGWCSVACEPGHVTWPVSGDGTGDDARCVEDWLSGLTLSDPDRLADVWGASEPVPVFASTAFADRFGGMLGAVCGNLVLASGAWGGIFLCGSVARAWLRTGPSRAFQHAMCAKGAMRGRLERVRVSEIAAPYPALMGLSRITLGDAQA